MKRLLPIIIVFIIMITTISSSCVKTQCISSNVSIVEPLKVAVLLYKANDTYIDEVRRNLEEIQKENQGKVEFTFFDAMGDQNIQNKSIDKLLEERVDLYLVNLVDITEAKSVINKIKETNVPLILFNREPSAEDIKSYGKAIYIGSNAKEGGDLQGEVLVSEWNMNKDTIDKNKDGIMQYIMLEGDKNNPEAIGRTKYSVLTVQEAGIKTQELGRQICNFNKELAHIATENFFLRFGNKIEVIIANNDDMAIGAIQALQERNYNKGDKNKMITVVGVDATQEARYYISKGFMAGTVIQDARAMANALYISGVNLVSGNIATLGTDYKFDETGVAIRIPYKKYKQD